jgi:putative phosphoesterase
MRIAILSDIHDHLWNLAAAIRFVQDADVLLCCGDLCSPFVIGELAKFPGEIHIVFGNNDADLFRITAKATTLPRLHLHGELCEITLDQKKFAMNHFDYLAKPLARSGAYDFVCFGHNHELEVARAEACLLINPGPILGAKFPGGQWTDCAATFAILDTKRDTPAIFSIDPATKLVHPANLGTS